MDILKEKQWSLDQLSQQLSLLRRLQPCSSAERIPSKKDDFTIFVKKKFGEEYDDTIIESAWQKVVDHIKSKTVNNSLLNRDPILISDDEKNCNYDDSIVISSDEDARSGSNGRNLASRKRTTDKPKNNKDKKLTNRIPRSNTKEKRTRPRKSKTEESNETPLSEPKKQAKSKKRLSSIEAELLRKELLIDKIIETYADRTNPYPSNPSDP